jgi:hypothetical protein
MDMFKFMAEVHDNPAGGSLGFADYPREEKHFEVFHSVSNNIGNLHPKVVEAIVRFYTYLKMSRDAAMALRSWEKQTDNNIRQMHVVYVVKFLSPSMLWGFVALQAMGLTGVKQEREFLQQIERAYKSVTGGELSDLLKDHPRAAEIDEFFANPAAV